MMLYEMVKNLPEYPVLVKKFPDLTEYSKKVEVVEWLDEYAIADYNPEVVDEVEFWKMLFENGLIELEEFRERTSFLPTASKTLGIAFMYEDKVAFRGRPSSKVILHELGHCFFKETDAIWSEVYGGGELLLWLGLTTDLPINERSIIFHHELLKKILRDEVEYAHNIILENLKTVLPLKHVGAYALYAGILLPDAPMLDPEGEDEWEHVKPTKPMLLTFLTNIIMGSFYKDAFSIAFVKSLYCSF